MKLTDERIDYLAKIANDSDRTVKRLNELRSLGVEEMGEASFGIEGVFSGLYIERVWSYTNEQWDDYIKYIKELKIKKL